MQFDHLAPYNRRQHVMLTPELHDRVRLEAKKTDRSVSAIIRIALNERYERIDEAVKRVSMASG